MTKGDVGKVLVEPKNLYKRALLAKDAAAVQAVTITPASGGPITLTRSENDVWKLGDAEADADAAEDIAETIADLQADEILFGKTPEGFEAQVTIDVTLEGGEAHKLLLGPETDTGRQLVMEGKTSVFVITKEDADALTPSAESLKKPEPAEEATEPAESTAEVSTEPPEPEQPAAETAAEGVPEKEAPAPDTAAPEEEKAAPVEEAPAEAAAPAEGQQ